MQGKEFPSFLGIGSEESLAGDKSVWKKVFWADWNPVSEAFVWTGGKETIKGEKGCLSVGHYSGEKLREELTVSSQSGRFVFNDQDGANNLLYLPAGCDFRPVGDVGKAWVVEVSSSGEERKTEPVVFNLKPFSEKHVQWFGSWSDKSIPDTLHLGIESGCYEDLKAGSIEEYTETEHRHDKTLEIYLMVQGRTGVSFIRDEQTPTSKNHTLSHAPDRNYTVALNRGNVLFVFPSSGFYHAEPVPRYSGNPQITIAIKWNSGLPVDRNDKILHPKLRMA